jgi:predicted ABC-type transport system involved in lysophospholipase L1 biosynthesis ATPase subunit
MSFSEGEFTTILGLSGNWIITLIYSTHDQRVIDRARRIITLVDGAVAKDD